MATGRITVKSKLDFEELLPVTPGQYTFTVTVYDPSGDFPEVNADRAMGPLVSV